MIVRQCVRALLHSHDDRFLLMEVVDPGTDRAFWITPGGGKNAGETDRDALRRELYEETGFDGADIDCQVIWTRDFTLSWAGAWCRSIETYYWLRCEPFDARPTMLEQQVEAASFSRLEWWSLDDIAASNDVFTPLNLAAMINRLLEEGPPPAPIVLGR